MARKRTVAALSAALAAAGGSVAVTQVANAGGWHSGSRNHRGDDGHSHGRTATPIRHLVVIFQENVSFDHYFGTYPNAANTDGQTFNAAPGTPAVDGLLPATDPSIPPGLQHSANLLTSNPNSSPPARLDSSIPGQLTCDQDHNYSDEQKAFDNFNMDLFVQSVGTGGGNSPLGTPCVAKQVMDYYDGNTVTGLWNYAQHFAMSDNSYSTTFGPSSPGAINLISGNTGGVDTAHMVNSPSVATSTSPNADLTADGKGGYSLTSDAQPYWDDCSTRDAVALSGQNIGDLLNARGLSWGWFQGGERPNVSYHDALVATGNDPNQPTSTFTPNEFKSFYSNAANRPLHSSNQANCSTVHPIGVALGGTGQWGYKDDYIPHHEPFDYYASTANPHHLTIPTDASGNDTLAGLQTIGTDTQSYVGTTPQFDTPNHQYDESDFDQLVSALSKGDLPPSALPAVSFLKAPGWQDGHAFYSDPTDEQQFVTSEINALERTPDWSHTAVVVLYDDSDGWYDHQHASPSVINPSLSPADNLTNTTTTGPTSGRCGPSPQTTAPLAGEQGRCGFGPRQPLLVISPFAKENHVDHNLSNIASVVNLVEYNWRLPSIGGSADQVQASVNQSEGERFDLAGLFRFHGEDRSDKLFLDPKTGQPVGGGSDNHDHGEGHHEHGDHGHHHRR
jgi:phospholipase C